METLLRFRAAIRSKRPTKKEWEQEDDDQGYFCGEENKNNNRSRSVSRTTTFESLQTIKDDGWGAATRELPIPSCCTSLPQSYWEPLTSFIPC